MWASFLLYRWFILWVHRNRYLHIIQVTVAIISLLQASLMMYLGYKGNILQQVASWDFILEMITSMPFIITVSYKIISHFSWITSCDWSVVVYVLPDRSRCFFGGAFIVSNRSSHPQSRINCEPINGAQAVLFFHCKLPLFSIQLHVVFLREYWSEIK